MPIPETPGPARDQYVIDAVLNGQMQYDWAKITITTGGHTGQFAVFARPGKIDGIYVGVGARMLQNIADALGLSLLTPKLQDQMWMQAATRILPWLDYSPTKMQTTEWFRRSTAGIDGLLAKAGYSGGLAMGIGKPWQLSNALLAHPGRSENYGLYVPKGKAPGQNYFGVHAANTVTPTDAYVLQDPGWAHPLDQDDYSELISLVSRQCLIDGNPMDLAVVMQTPELSGLVSHEGPLKVLRQPGVPIQYCPAPPASSAVSSAAPVQAAGDGSNGLTVCPIQVTGLPQTVGGGGGGSGDTSISLGKALAVGGGILALAAGGAWLVRRSRGHRV